MQDVPWIFSRFNWSDASKVQRACFCALNEMGYYDKGHSLDDDILGDDRKIPSIKTGTEIQPLYEHQIRNKYINKLEIKQKYGKQDLALEN